MSHRILHISTAKTWRGGEQQMAYLINGLQTKGHHPAICCRKQSAVEDWCLRQSLPHRTFQFGILGAAVSIQHLCKTQHYDLVHAHDSRAHSAAWLSAVLFSNSLPIIVSRRVIFPLKKSGPSFWKYTHQCVAAINCVSQAIREEVCSALPDDHHAKVKLVHDGIDLHQFDKAASGKLHRCLNLPSDTLLVGYVAALSAEKDHRTFLRTAAQLASVHQNVHFVLIGKDGGQQAAIEQQISMNHLQQRVHLLGFRKDVAELLPDLRVLLFTSRKEGLGTAILEAMAAGVPVVATRTGGIPEAVLHQQTGFLVDVGDDDQMELYCTALLTDDALHAQMRTAAFRHVQHFSSSRMVDQTLAVYRQVW